MELLVRNYNLGVIEKMMCFNVLNVNWKGELFDCDFNQQLEMAINTKENSNNMHVHLVHNTNKTLTVNALIHVDRFKP